MVPQHPVVRSCDEVAAQLRGLGVRPGGVLLVHTSFRAVRPVEGGPAGLIEALLAALGPKGTLVMPSWTERDDEVFDPGSTPAARDLGVAAEVFRRRPSVLRSAHPFAFAAEGPRAAEIVRDPLPVPPHIAASPVGRVRELDGQVLLLGVGHAANTTIHLAETIVRVPYGIRHYVTVEREGRPVRLEYLENDCCCERFALVEDWLRAAGRQAEGEVGHADARLAHSRDVVEIVVERLRADPMVFLHPPGAGCAECDDARRSVSGLR